MNTLKLDVPAVNTPFRAFTTPDAPVTALARETVDAPAPLPINTLLVPEELPR